MAASVLTSTDSETSEVTGGGVPPQLYIQHVLLDKWTDQEKNIEHYLLIKNLLFSSITL